MFEMLWPGPLIGIGPGPLIGIGFRAYGHLLCFLWLYSWLTFPQYKSAGPRDCAHL